MVRFFEFSADKYTNALLKWDFIMEIYCFQIIFRIEEAICFFCLIY